MDSGHSICNDGTHSTIDHVQRLLRNCYVLVLCSVIARKLHLVQDMSLRGCHLPATTITRPGKSLKVQSCARPCLKGLEIYARQAEATSGLPLRNGTLSHNGTIGKRHPVQSKTGSTAAGITTASAIFVVGAILSS